MFYCFFRIPSWYLTLNVKYAHRGTVEAGSRNNFDLVMESFKSSLHSVDDGKKILLKKD